MTPSNPLSPQVFDSVLLPANEQAEAALLATCLAHPRQFAKVQDTLTPDDFHHLGHSLAWDALQKITRDGMQIGAVTLSDRLQRSQTLDTFTIHGHPQISGENAIAALMTSNHSNVRDIETLVAIVKNLSSKRKLFYLISKHVEPVLNGIPAPEIIKSLQTGLREIELQAVSAQDEILDTKAGLTLAVEALENKTKGIGLPISTGLVDLDTLLGGWHKTDLITIAGRPGAGKTSFLLSTAVSAAKGGKRVGFFSLEMSPDQLWNRIISQESGIPGNLIRDGKLADEQWPIYATTLEHMESLTIHIAKAPDLDLPRIRTFTRKMSYLGLDLLCIDYLQLITPDRGVESRVQEVSRITRSLKLLARELNIPILVAAQMNRAIESRGDKEPVLSDLRESGSIEQDSDIVIFTYPPGSDNGNTVRTLKVAKHRNGATGYVEAYFNPQTTKLSNLQTRKVDLNSSGQREVRDYVK